MVRLENLVICDDVRMENTGKLLVIGMYLDSIVVPELPFLLRGLTLLQVYSVADTQPSVLISVRLRVGQTAEVLGEREGRFSVANPGTIISVLKFDVQFSSQGQYVFELDVEGEPRIQKGFGVILGSAVGTASVEARQ